MRSMSRTALMVAIIVVGVAFCAARQCVSDAGTVLAEATPMPPSSVAAAPDVAAVAKQEPASPYRDSDSQRLSWKDVWLMLLGALISLYATVVFERYNRFGELMRTVARARQHFEGNPSSPDPPQLKRSHELGVAFFRLLDETEWSLNAEGHFDAAVGVARLKGFIYREVACVENMLAGRTKGMAVSQYLSLVTMEYAEVWGRDFVAFERNFRPRVAALLRPYPHPVLPVGMTSVVVNYFDQLL